MKRVKQRNSFQTHIWTYIKLAAGKGEWDYYLNNTICLIKIKWACALKHAGVVNYFADENYEIKHFLTLH